MAQGTHPLIVSDGHYVRTCSEISPFGLMMLVNEYAAKHHPIAPLATGKLGAIRFKEGRACSFPVWRPAATTVAVLLAAVKIVEVIMIMAAALMFCIVKIRNRKWQMYNDVVIAFRSPKAEISDTQYRKKAQLYAFLDAIIGCVGDLNRCENIGPRRRYRRRGGCLVIDERRRVLGRRNCSVKWGSLWPREFRRGGGATGT